MPLVGKKNVDRMRVKFAVALIAQCSRKQCALVRKYVDVKLGNAPAAVNRGTLLH